MYGHMAASFSLLKRTFAHNRVHRLMALYARSTQTNLSAREVALRSSHGHHSIGGGTFRFAIDIDLGQFINRTPERVAAASLAWCARVAESRSNSRCHSMCRRKR